MVYYLQLFRDLGIDNVYSYIVYIAKKVYSYVVCPLYFHIYYLYNNFLHCEHLFNTAQNQVKPWT